MVLLLKSGVMTDCGPDSAERRLSPWPWALGSEPPILFNGPTFMGTYGIVLRTSNEVELAALSTTYCVYNCLFLMSVFHIKQRVYGA